MFPGLKDLKKESVTWERLFLFDLFVEKKKRNSLFASYIKYFGACNCEIWLGFLDCSNTGGT